MSKPVLLTASWCFPCKDVKDYINTHQLDVEIIDVDIHRDVAQKYGIRSVPVLVVDEFTRFTNSKSIISYLGGLQLDGDV